MGIFDSKPKQQPSPATVADSEVTSTLRIQLRQGESFIWTSVADTQEKAESAWKGFLAWFHDEKTPLYALKSTNGETGFLRRDVSSYQIETKP